MVNRFARPTPATLARYRSERDMLLGQARANYDAHGDARRTLDLLRQARERQRKVLWARRALDWAETVPDPGRGPGGRRRIAGEAPRRHPVPETR